MTFRVYNSCDIKQTQAQHLTQGTVLCCVTQSSDQEITGEVFFISLKEKMQSSAFKISLRKKSVNLFPVTIFLSHKDL